MNKDTINLIKDSGSTALNIALMAQYRIKHVQDRDAKAKQKMYKHAFYAAAGIACLFTIGIVGLAESRKIDNRVMGSSW